MPLDCRSVTARNDIKCCMWTAQCKFIYRRMHCSESGCAGDFVAKNVYANSKRWSLPMSRVPGSWWTAAHVSLPGKANWSQIIKRNTVQCIHTHTEQRASKQKFWLDSNRYFVCVCIFFSLLPVHMSISDKWEQIHYINWGQPDLTFPVSVFVPLQVSTPSQKPVRRFGMTIWLPCVWV